MVFIDASKENRYSLDDNHPSVTLDGESKHCSKKDNTKRTALELEMEGRIRGLYADVDALDARSRTNEGSAEYRTEELRMLQMVSTILRFIYYIVLVIGLILYAYERWFEYYEDEAHDEALMFIMVGTALVVGPQYLLDAVIYVYGLFTDMSSGMTD